MNSPSKTQHDELPTAEAWIASSERHELDPKGCLPGSGASEVDDDVVRSWNDSNVGTAMGCYGDLMVILQWFNGILMGCTLIVT